MVSRTAYAQLHYSPLLLPGTVVGLALTYLAPVALAMFGGGVPHYRSVYLAVDGIRVPPHAALLRTVDLWAPALPAIAAMYMAFTVDFAYQHARGRGGMWKGRAQANISEAR